MSRRDELLVENDIRYFRSVGTGYKKGMLLLGMPYLIQRDENYQRVGNMAYLFYSVAFNCSSIPFNSSIIPFNRFSSFAKMRLPRIKYAYSIHPQYTTMSRII